MSYILSTVDLAGGGVGATDQPQIEELSASNLLPSTDCNVPL